MQRRADVPLQRLKLRDRSLLRALRAPQLQLQQLTRVVRRLRDKRVRPGVATMFQTLAARCFAFFRTGQPIPFGVLRLLPLSRLRLLCSPEACSSARLTRDAFTQSQTTVVTRSFCNLLKDRSLRSS